MPSFALKNRRLQIVIAICGLLLANFVVFARAHAVTYMTHSQVIEYNMEASGTSSVAVAFTAGASDASGSLAINFGSWGGTVNTTQSIATTGCQALTGATNVLPGSLTGGGSGSIATVSGVTALTAGQSYCVILSSASAVTNPIAGTYPVTLTDGTDTATTGIDVIGNDQYTVSATVPPTFTMSLSGTSDTFTSSLSASAPATTSGITATVSTNGNYGWGLWAEDSEAGLHSASQSHTIPTVATGSNANMTTDHGTEAYAIGATTNYTTDYNDSTGTAGGGLSASSYNEIASGSSAVSSATTVVKELADISATTPAASDYGDTVTLVGDGSF